MSNFKIAHLSDIHAGYRSTRVTNAQGINLREADGYIAFAKVVKEVIQEDADCVLICGDVFHTPNPEMRTIIFVQNQLRLLAAANIPVYILAGNHDTNDVKADIAASRVLHDPERNIFSHVEPYVKYEVGDGIFIHLISHHMYSEQEKTMSQVKPVDDAINIFATHGSVVDPILKISLHTEQSPREIVIPDFMFKDNRWDYALLGHIHERGWVDNGISNTDSNDTKIFYNGSLIRRGFSDKDVPLGRGWTLWEIDSSGVFSPTIRKVSQRPQFDFPILDASSMSLSDVSENIVNNFEATQLNGSIFDSATAPILRQRISGIDQGKIAILNQKNITQAAKHALQWSIKVVSSREKTNNVVIDDNLEELGDIVKIYDDWISKSSTIDKVEKNMRKPVKERARQFIEFGQDKILND